MRPGEIFALSWADVDFEAKEIRIRHSLQENPRKIVPAKADSARDIPLAPFMVDVLRRHRAEMMARKEKYRSAYVFTNRLGEWLAPKTMNADLKKACEAAGLPKLTLYNLRHTGVSLLGEARVPIRVISDLAGHADSSITLDIYSHSTSQMLREGVDLVAQLVRSASTSSP